MYYIPTHSIYHYININIYIYYINIYISISIYIQGFIWGQIFGGGTHTSIYMYVCTHMRGAARRGVAQA